MGTDLICTPEPPLLPPESPPSPLRCCRCHRATRQALSLYCGPLCRSCLAEAAGQCTLDELSAMFCAEILTAEEEFYAADPHDRPLRPV